MGVTLDLIPRLPGEAPERAIARIYREGIELCWDPDTLAMTLEAIDDEGEPVEEAPPGAFDEWRAEVRRRLAEIHPWQTTFEYGWTYVWSPNYRWQVEIHPDADDITLRHRRGWDPDPVLPHLADTDLLAAFEGLLTILHWPMAHGTWVDLDDPHGRASVTL